jgi:hypothetical protein
VLLELRDATLLVPNLSKMTAVMAAIPRLETFVAQVGGAPLIGSSAVRVQRMPLICWVEQQYWSASAGSLIPVASASSLIPVASAEAWLSH